MYLFFCLNFFFLQENGWMAVLTLPSDIISPAKEGKKHHCQWFIYCLSWISDSYSCVTINPVSLTVEKGAKFLCLTMWACSIRSAWYARISHLENFCKARLSLCPVNNYGGLKEFVDVPFLKLASGGKKTLFGPYRIFDAVSPVTTGETEQLRSRYVQFFLYVWGHYTLMFIRSRVELIFHGTPWQN